MDCCTTVGVYPGSFDPLTCGHLDVIERALKFIPTLRVMVGTNVLKGPALLRPADRVALIEASCQQWGERILVESFDGLLIDYLVRINASLVIRGVRNESDFGSESRFAEALSTIAHVRGVEVSTVYLRPSEHLAAVSSSMVREFIALGAWDVVESLIPSPSVPLLKQLLMKGSGDRVRLERG